MNLLLVCVSSLLMMVAGRIVCGSNEGLSAVLIAYVAGVPVGMSLVSVLNKIKK